jgi:hypothetical protein
VGRLGAAHAIEQRARLALPAAAVTFFLHRRRYGPLIA